MFGRMLNERLGKWHFWLLFIGFWVTFMPQYVVGLLGMPRRVASYPSNLGWQSYNIVSTVGAFIIGFSFAFLLSTSSCRGAIPSRPATTRGTATRSSGSPPRPRRTTTTPTCPRSARSGRPGTTTTRTPLTVPTDRPEAAAKARKKEPVA
jgi:heme/copper-type cytochrome/quinol oxidase subunit 1